MILMKIITIIKKIWRRGGAGGGGACEGETSGVGGVRVPEGSSQGSSTRSSSGTTVTKI